MLHPLNITCLGCLGRKKSHKLRWHEGEKISFMQQGNNLSSPLKDPKQIAEEKVLENENIV